MVIIWSLLLVCTAIGQAPNETHTFSKPIVISATQASRALVYGVDVDNDSNVDVISIARETDQPYHYKLLCSKADGQGGFSDPTIIDTVHESSSAPSYHMYSADLDADGSQDLLLTGTYGPGGFDLSWYKNDGQGGFAARQIISPWSTNKRYLYLYAVDLDNDGDKDVIAGEEGAAVWFQNDGQGGFSSEKTIPTTAGKSVYAADLNDDGFADVISSSYSKDTITFCLNDGQGGFLNETIVYDGDLGAGSVILVDLDGDGDLDILASTYRPLEGYIFWFQNIDGQGNFGAQRVIGTGYHGDVYAADVDGDNDFDVIARGDDISWYENDGQGSFGDKKMIDDEVATDIFPVDLDNDGDADLVSSGGYDEYRKLVWYRSIPESEASDASVVAGSLLSTFIALVALF